MTQQHDDGPVSSKHATLIFERELTSSVAAAFAAFADAKARAVWGTPSDTAVLLYDEENFQEGGRDRFRCGSKTNPHIHGITEYLEIIENVRIVSLERIQAGGRQLCASLNTLELSPICHGTALRFTVQLVSFVGIEIIEGNEVGHKASLDNLVGYLQARGAA